MSNIDARPYLYILEGQEHKAVPVTDVVMWAAWMQANDRVVEQTEVGKEYLVSTVFLGVENGWFSDTPIVFETMVFKKGKPLSQVRYSTWNDAKAGHEKILKELP
jgi:hypothetical protein